jgi:hypothetical protein
MKTMISGKPPAETTSAPVGVEGNIKSAVCSKDAIA